MESTLGVGTTFRIYLPVLAAVPAEAPLALATRPPVHGTVLVEWQAAQPCDA